MAGRTFLPILQAFFKFSFHYSLPFVSSVHIISYFKTENKGVYMFNWIKNKVIQLPTLTNSKVEHIHPNLAWLCRQHGVLVWVIAKTITLMALGTQLPPIILTGASCRA
jgi:hypothetical protein